MKSFDKMDKKYEQLIKTMFDKSLLGSCEFKQKKVIIKLLICAKKNLDLNTFDKHKMKFVINKVWKEIVEKKRQYKSTELEKFIEKQLKTAKSENSDESSNDEK